MSKMDFEKSEFDRRQQRVRAEMERQGIDLLLATSPISINYLVGSRTKSYLSLQCLVFPLKESPLTLLSKRTEVPENIDLCLADECFGHGGPRTENPVEVLIEFLKKRGIQGLRVGVEAPAFYFHPLHYERLKAFLGSQYVDASSLVERLKYVKSPAEIAYIRKAAEILDVGVRKTIEVLKTGITECELNAQVQCAMLSIGGEQAASPSNIGSGYRSCYPHGLPTEKVIEQGDFITTEYFSSYKRYNASIGRQYCMGKPTSRMQEVYDASRAAVDACVEVMGPGVPTVVAHDAAKRAIEERGLGEFRVHMTGFGVAPGFPPAWMESIGLFDGDQNILTPGMVLSVEPPVFIHSEGLGARVIENVLITETGREVLSRVSRDLVVVD